LDQLEVDGDAVALADGEMEHDEKTPCLGASEITVSIL